MKRIIFILYIGFLGLVCQPQRGYAQADSVLKLDKTYVQDIISFSVNNLGEIYLINSSNQLKKLDGKGDSAGVFNQVTKYGKLTYVESQNPWKTILFYGNFSTIVLLDKFLNVLTSINLRKHNIFEVKAVTSSYDNHIWVYDETDNKLKKIDDAGNTILETVDLRTLLDPVPSPVQIIDGNGFVYLYDPNIGLYTFDSYGTYKNKLAFLHWKHVAVNGKYIFGFDSTYFYSYELGTMKFKKYLLPPVFAEYTSVKVGNSKIYLLKDKKLMVYSISNIN